MSSASRIPVLRPRLPPAEQLLPYLQRIDEAGVYTNWGPLNDELEQRLSERFGLPAGSVVSAGSGTAALVGAILAVAGRATPERPLAIVPAFTFVATALAAEQCGYSVFLADVDAETWTLDPARLAHALETEQVGVVIPVAPFGRPVAQAPWREFREATGIPVAIDAAAGFELVDASSFGDIPVAMSFHATKSFATGEGGCVVVTDEVRREDAMQALNFGFRGTRDAASASVNGKLSEYHAAVGLAELDGWTEKRAALVQVADRYREEFATRGLGAALIAAPNIASCYALLECRDEDESARVEMALVNAAIDNRRWYGRGLRHETHFRDAPGERSDTTDSLSARLLGLPVAADLERPQIERIARAVAEAIEP